MKSRYKIATAVVASFVLGVGAASVFAQVKPPAYIVAEIDVKDQDGYNKEFLPKAQANIKEMGGKYLMDAVKAFSDKQRRLEDDLGNKYASFRAIGIEGVEQK